MTYKELDDKFNIFLEDLRSKRDDLGRSNQARYLAIVITQLEIAYGMFNTFVNKSFVDA